MRLHIHRLLGLALTAVLLSAASCDKDPLSLSPEELADRIRANTPTELPPITMTGANTMGAYIHPQPGSPLWEQAGRVDSFLFVASGVDRPETALAESLDCGAFNNYLIKSTSWISVQGIYCRRPEIGDDRFIALNFGYLPKDSVQLALNVSLRKALSMTNYWTREFSGADMNYTILRDDRATGVLSGTFSGQVLNRASPYDTVEITDGRFDITYGVTP